MPIQTTTHIWHNGNLIPWDKAQIHVMSHVVHYGSSVFEGIRCYAQPNAAGIFRLPEHMARLVDSAKIYRMPLPYTVEQLSGAVIDVVEANGVAPCYIRPIAFRGYGELGVNPLKSPVEVYIANYPWGKYVPGTSGADVCVSSWSRLAPNTMPTLAKAGANYMNSQLIRMEAEINGYSEGIGLDTNGYLSEGSGENLFLVRGGVLYTTPLANSVLNGITRSSVLTLAKQLGIEVVEQALPREMLYICEEAFFTGTFCRSNSCWRRHDGSDYESTARRVLWDRPRHAAGPPQLVDAGECEGRGAGRRISNKNSQREAAFAAAALFAMEHFHDYLFGGDDHLFFGNL
jgi:branched-chain amino acid aminotransferase